MSDGPAVPLASTTTVMLEGSAGPMRVHVHRLSEGHKGWAIVTHGRNGAADAPHMTPIITAALMRGLGVVAPDLCASAHNLSAGAAADFTMGGHLADLCAVAAWAAGELAAEPAGPRILVGHSMGAYASLRLAAEGGPFAATGVVAVSPVVSGAALIAAREAEGPHVVAHLREELPGAFDEWPQHDILPLAGGITMPVAVIVGEIDTVTPPRDAARLAAAVPNCVWHSVLAEEHHCPLGAAYGLSLGEAFDRLISA
ncbi:hypothetical protein ATO13_11861 [Stappia sp. 22II-S9-Z10]|nr:hypothetical protein ATO13_11861 [Stappia sp. 22II-S9-Z10]